MCVAYRTAGEDDLNELCALVQAAIKAMEAHAIPQWDERYPDREILREDIGKKQLYVGTQGGKIAVFYVLNGEFDAAYRNGNWQCTGRPFSVVHRLCVDPALQNQGIGRKTMRHLQEQALGMGSGSIRLDVFSRNPFALRLYQSLGYSRVGSADWRKGRFYLMEKNLVQI
jgi:ribosomal protein S18 acetylase RimI-like enzyme